MTTWEENWKRVGELWPGFDPLPAEKELFVDRLGKVVHQDWLRHAIDEHRAEGTFRPQLHEILDRYHKIYWKHHPPARTTAGPMPSAEEIENDARRCRALVGSAKEHEVSAAVSAVSRWVNVPSDRGAWQNAHFNWVAASISDARSRKAAQTP